MKIELELKNGKRRKFNPQVAKVLIARGVAFEIDSEAPGLGYQTRMMQADPAPYGYKADGTPRKRPGRPAKE